MATFVAVNLKTKKQVAEMLGIKTKDLSVYIGRGKVDVVPGGADACIDIDSDKNKAFIDRALVKRGGATRLVKLHPDNTTPQVALPGQQQATEDEDGGKTLAELAKDPTLANMSYADLEKLYKHRQNEALRFRAMKDAIEIEKKRGEVIPSELMPALVIRHNQHFIVTFKNTTDQILTDFGKLRDFTPKEFAEMRKRMLDAINEGADEAVKMTQDSIREVINDYTVKRGVGERDR